MNTDAYKELAKELDKRAALEIMSHHE